MAIDDRTKEQILDIWRSAFPASYTVPIEEEADGQGLDAYSQQAAQFARVAQAFNTTCQAYFLKPHSAQTAPPAGGATKAVGQVLLSRTAPATGPVTVPAGTQVKMTIANSVGTVIDGSIFVTTEEVVFAAGALGPIIAPIQAARVGYQGNLDPGSIDTLVELGTSLFEDATVGADNEVTDTGLLDQFNQSMVGRYVRFESGANVGTFPRQILSYVDNGENSTVVLSGPALAQPDTANISLLEWNELISQVDQQTATTGGKHGWLDAIGLGRGVGRLVGETDAVYRERLCSMTELVSPDAMTKIVASVLTPLGIPFRIKETRDLDGLGGFILDFHALDNGSYENGDLLLSLKQTVRYFIICVGEVDFNDFGANYDAPSMNIGAWDELFYDGFPAGFSQAMNALYQAIEDARAAGITWDIVVDPDL